MNDKCPNCEELINSTSSRLIEDSCGHKKCRLCLVQEEDGCLTCKRLQQVSGSPPELSSLPSVPTPSPAPPVPPSPPPSKRKKKPSTKPPQPSRNHIKTLPGVPESYQCTICSKTFRNKKSKCYHDVCLTGIKPYHCAICNRHFVKKSHFEYHERVHSGFKPFTCSLCPKAFPQKNKLNRHMLSHTQEKKYLCPNCGKRYSKKEDLKGHMYLHTGTLPYTCDICGKSFRMRANLNRHQQIHSSDRPFVCTNCGKGFKDKSLLVRHERTHGKERPYSCAHCTSVFISKSELLRHLAIHSDVKPFFCHICKTSFRRKDNLTRHIRHHHADGAVGGKTSSSPSSSAMTTTTAVARVIKKKPDEKKKKKTSLEKRGKSLIEVVEPGENYQRINAIGNFIPVIRAPGESSNAVPVIKKRPENDPNNLTHLRSIPCAAAVEINQRIEEKLYLNEDLIGLPPLRQNIAVCVENFHDDGEKISSNLDDDSGPGGNKKCTIIMDETIKEGGNCVSTIKQNSWNYEDKKNLHWRRRTAENLKSFQN